MIFSLISNLTYSLIYPLTGDIGPLPPVDSFLLLENGDFLLTETGDKFIMEQ